MRMLTIKIPVVVECEITEDRFLRDYIGSAFEGDAVAAWEAGGEAVVAFIAKTNTQSEAIDDWEAERTFGTITVVSED